MAFLERQRRLVVWNQARIEAIEKLALLCSGGSHSQRQVHLSASEGMSRTSEQRIQTEPQKVSGGCLVRSDKFENRFIRRTQYKQINLRQLSQSVVNKQRQEA